jgi:hypothetical protein
MMAPGLGLAALCAAAAQEPPRFGANVEVVRVEAVVLDAKHEPVPGLTAADFEVTDEGVARPLLSFEAIEVHAPPSRATRPSSGGRRPSRADPGRPV